MAITGKLIGALIGSIAGPFGTFFGGLIGHLFDRASEERTFVEGAAGAPPGAQQAAWRRRADPVSQAQINFLTCLIGLSVAVASIDGRVKSSHIEAMRTFFRRNFSFSTEDQYLIQRLIDEMYRNSDRIDVQGLCAYYAALSAPEGRVLLLRLLFQIARADEDGVSRREEELIRNIAQMLGLGEQAFRQVRAEFVRESGRAWEVLGIGPDAGVEEIKSAYRQLTMANHPDKVANLGPEFVKVAEEKFKAIQEAYEEIRREKGF
ncbi:MAG: TerB family tellurite resistance protein [Spirochaetia bacterium]|jgi:DnaJ like chaperone protein